MSIALLATVSVARATFVEEEPNSPLLQLLESKKGELVAPYERLNFEKQFQASLHERPPMIGLMWQPGMKQKTFVTIHLMSPDERRPDPKAFYINLQYIMPEAHRMTRGIAEEEIYTEIPNFSAIRPVFSDLGTFWFPLRYPKQFDPLAPVYRWLQYNLSIQPKRTLFSEVNEKVFFTSLSREGESQKLSITGTSYKAGH
jgi:hypothetical protein